MITLCICHDDDDCEGDLVCTIDGNCVCDSDDDCPGTYICIHGNCTETTHPEAQEITEDLVVASAAVALETPEGKVKCTEDEDCADDLVCDEEGNCTGSCLCTFRSGRKICRLVSRF